MPRHHSAPLLARGFPWERSSAGVNSVTPPSRSSPSPAARALSPEKVAADFNIPVVYDSLAEMLADAELDAVISATPGPAHYATSMEILSAGKHLITDKPLPSTVAEADQRSAPWPQRTTS